MNDAGIARLHDARRRGGIASAAIRQRCLEDRATDDLVAFDPGPPAGPHDAWIDCWRRRRVEREVAAAARLRTEGFGAGSAAHEQEDRS